MKDLWNRASLKSFFKKGKLPSEIHFAYLIDSVVNKLDDGFAKTDKDGFQLSPTGETNTVLSIYTNQAEENPSWQISLNKNENGVGLAINSISLDTNGKAVQTTRLYLSNDGKVGIGTTDPKTLLDVAGTLTVKNRVGAYTKLVDGDGDWHDVISGLSGMEAFEAVGRIDGPPKRGKYAITHAIALSAFGRRFSGRIKHTRAYFGWFFNRIDFRWKGEWQEDESYLYRLQVRTRSNYGKKPDGSFYKIKVHLTRLWDDSIFQTL